MTPRKAATLACTPVSSSRPIDIRSSRSLPFGESPLIGPYELCCRIGVGGMGTVYLARDDRQTRARRLAAIKLIHPHLAEDPDFVDMFFDEADIASRIEHPHVVRTFDYGQVAAMPYLAMEYLRGEPLTHLFRALSQGGSTERSAMLAVRAVADACEGVHAAHELHDEHGVPLEVVHRDVCPANVFLTYDGVIKVVDFGTVRTARQRHRTRTGLVKGKCAYVAPEILLSRPFDRRADVWALGVLLWELLTRKRLFCRDMDAQTLRAVLEHQPQAPSLGDRSLPGVYDTVVLTALQRDPDERYPTARDFGRALQKANIAHGEPVDLADLSHWMDELFPSGRDRHRAILQLAEEGDCENATEPYGVTASRSRSQLTRCTDAFVAARSPDATRRFHTALSLAAMALSALCLVLVAVLELTDDPRARHAVAAPGLGTSVLGSALHPQALRPAVAPADPASASRFPHALEPASRVLLCQRPVEAVPKSVSPALDTPPLESSVWLPDDI